MEKNLQDFQPSRNRREVIPHHLFEIKGKAFMVALHDDTEPKTIRQALSSRAGKE